MTTAEAVLVVEDLSGQSPLADQGTATLGGEVVGGTFQFHSNTYGDYFIGINATKPSFHRSATGYVHPNSNYDGGEGFQTSDLPLTFAAASAGGNGDHFWFNGYGDNYGAGNNSGTVAGVNYLPVSTAGGKNGWLKVTIADPNNSPTVALDWFIYDDAAGTPSLDAVLAVPEPSALLLFSLGLAGVFRRRRQQGGRTAAQQA